MRFWKFIKQLSEDISSKEENQGSENDERENSSQMDTIDDKSQFEENENGNDQTPSIPNEEEEEEIEDQSEESSNETSSSSQELEDESLTEGQTGEKDNVQSSTNQEENKDQIEGQNQGEESSNETSSSSQESEDKFLTEGQTGENDNGQSSTTQEEKKDQREEQKPSEESSNETSSSSQELEDESLTEGQTGENDNGQLSTTQEEKKDQREGQNQSEESSENSNNQDSKDDKDQIDQSEEISSDENIEAEEEETKEEPNKKLPQKSNEFLNKLNELPSFEKRQRQDGYAIDTNGSSELPESIIRTLITKFLNQRFCKRESELNHRSNSLEKSRGFYKWEVKDVIVHYKTHQVTKVLQDKYSYDYEQGRSENVPLSFYFDMSGSMSNYTNMLATIAIELLKKDVKVLIGFNERVNVQIESIDSNIEISELSKILNSASYSNYGYGHAKRDFIKDSHVRYKMVERNIDDYLIDKRCEKCVVFSDFDPKSEVIKLSQKAQVYWFCFERYFTSGDLNNFNGFIYQVNNALDILDGLVKVNEKRFETLCYVDNDKVLKRSSGKR